jgi:alpha-tubulin suppressor-like RCC1 family protein
VVGIAAGQNHSLALKADGTVIAWGDGSAGQTAVRDGLTGVVAIAAGFFHGLALKSDGTVVAWGQTYDTPARVPAGLTGVVAIAAGGYNSVALKADGTVVAWGVPEGSIVPEGLRGVVALAGGWGHGLALVAGTNQTLAPAIAIHPFSQVALGGSNPTFRVLAAGDSLNYQWLKNGMPIDGAASPAYSLANLRTDDAGAYSVKITNPYGSVTSSNAVLTVVPMLMTEQPQNQTPMAGWTVNFRATVSSHAPLSYQWRKDGSDINGATNSGYAISNVQSRDTGSYSVVVTNVYGSVTSSNAVLTLSSIPFPALADRTPGTVIAWGANQVGQSNVPAGLHGVAAIAAGAAHNLALKSDGTVAAWGYPIEESSVTDGLQGFDLRLLPVSFDVDGWNGMQGDGAPAVFVARDDAGFLYFKVVDENRRIISQRVEAELLNEAESLRALKQQLAGRWGQEDLTPEEKRTIIDLIESILGKSRLSDVVAIAAGYTRSLALKSDGTVVAWGYSSYGNYQVPDGLNGVVAIAAGGYALGDVDIFEHFLALRSDGTVVGWGGASVPDALNDVIAIAAGGFHSLALKSDGTVVAWGSNDEGQIDIPAGLNGVVAIAAGVYHSLALKSDGTVVAWGYNYYGQSTVPEGLSGVVSIAAGYFHSLALKSDGTVTAWGSNWAGTVPVGLTGVIAIAAGESHNLALIANAPALVVQASGENVALSWPLWAQGFTLRSTTNLVEENSWTPELTAPVIEGSQNRVIQTISGPVKFYRLKK